MSLELVTAPDRESVTAIEESLDGMLERLRAIVAAPPLTQDTLVEIMAIYNNVAYIYLYLEAIDDEVNYQRLLPRRAAFHDDPELDALLLRLLQEQSCPDPEVDEARLEYIDQLRRGLHHDPTADQKVNGLLGRARTVLGDLHRDQAALLERLGVKAGSASPEATFYRLMGGTSKESTRQKLALAWRTRRDAHRDDLVGVVDEIVEVRRADSAAAGFRNVLARSLIRSRVDESAIESFLDDYLARALAAHRRLEDEIREVTGIAERPADHFGFAMHSVFGRTPTPLLALDECLEFAFAVTRAVFGVDVVRVDDSRPDVIAVDVLDGDRPVGQIKFDLWNKGTKIAANHTNGIRNRTDWNGLVQRPVAYVACRFQSDRAGRSRITFQNVHSLFHEFGHAVNHLLIRKRLSFQSGLEYLPPERLECLSMWFEKWVYHPEFARHVGAPEDDSGAWARCARIKMLEYRRTYADRAISAALDFEVNRSGEGGLADAWARLDRRLGVSSYADFADFPAYFTWPMYVAKPGANFSYLWGSADSTVKFAPFLRLGLAEVAARTDLRDLFTAFFDFDAQSPVPDIASVFSFYDAASLSGAG